MKKFTFTIAVMAIFITSAYSNYIQLKVGKTYPMVTLDKHNTWHDYIIGYAKNVQHSDPDWRVKHEEYRSHGNKLGIMKGARMKVLEIKNERLTAVLLQPRLPSGFYAPHGTIFDVLCHVWVSAHGYKNTYIRPEIQYPDQPAVEPILDTLVPEFETGEKKHITSAKAPTRHPEIKTVIKAVHQNRNRESALVKITVGKTYPCPSRVLTTDRRVATLVNGFMGYAKNPQHGGIKYPGFFERRHKRGVAGTVMEGAKVKVLEVKDAVATVVLLQPSLPNGPNAPSGVIYKIHCADWLEKFGYKYKDQRPEIQYPDQLPVEPIFDTVVPEFDTIAKREALVADYKANREAIMRARRKMDNFGKDAFTPTITEKSEPEIKTVTKYVTKTKYVYIDRGTGRVIKTRTNTGTDNRSNTSTNPWAGHRRHKRNPWGRADSSIHDDDSNTTTNDRPAKL